MAITYIPLDFETTGTDCWGDVTGGKPAAPIQIGIYVPAADMRRKYYIGGWDWNKYEWNETSESIHQIPRSNLDNYEPAWKVDIRITADLLDVTGSRMFNVPLGWNVAGFDRQFITRHFPSLNRILSYRSVDLNAIIFSMVDSEKQYNELKKMAKEYAATQMEGDRDWHDALYDAEASWYAFQYLRG